jgi:hypothetical protein
VRETLDKYRLAYDALNARAAQAIWPKVNVGQLERAFDQLESQRVTFDDCRIDAQGILASASCRGSVQYTPKVGGRDRRVEARIWNFTLVKSGDAWTIETVRADR